MRPAWRYWLAVAWAKVLVWASLNCLHITALASSAGSATIQPTRKPGDNTFDNEPQYASNSLEPGTVLLNASNEGGGASPKYKSPYGSSSTISVLYLTASSSTFLRRSSVSSAPLGLP